MDDMTAPKNVAEINPYPPGGWLQYKGIKLAPLVCLFLDSIKTWGLNVMIDS